MKYKVDKKIRPAYLQIYKQIKDDIINGNYKYATKLPSKRLLAEETETSTITIEHAYELLCDEGYVESRERSGFFVIFRTSDGFALPSTEKTTKSESSSKKAVDVQPVVQQPAAPVSQSSDDATVAAIIAAISAYISDDANLSKEYANGFRVVSFKRVRPKSSWNNKNN
jgi:GntR family transcriptional regulator/MocR family aminotransferase